MIRNVKRVFLVIAAVAWLLIALPVAGMMLWVVGGVMLRELVFPHWPFFLALYLLILAQTVMEQKRRREPIT